MSTTVWVQNPATGRAREVTPEKAAMLALSGWPQVPPPSGGSTEPVDDVITRSELVEYVAANGGGGGGGSTPDATTSVKGKQVLLGGTAAAPTVPATALTGTIDDARIPAGIARDAEVTAAVVQAVADLRGGNVPANLDTLLEIVNQLAADESGAAALAATVAQKAPRLTPTVPAKTSAYTAIAGEFVLADAAGGAVPIAISAASAGASLAVKKTDPSANPVTLTLPDSSTITLTTQHETRTLIATGSTWYVASGLITMAALDGRYMPLPSGTPEVGKVVAVAAVDGQGRVTGWNLIAPAGGGGGGAVSSVAGRIGDVVIGWADLSGMLPTSKLPPLGITDVFPVTNQAARLALTAQRGDIAVQANPAPAKTYALATDDPTQDANWVLLPAIGSVQTVNGQQGAVVLAASDIGAVPISLIDAKGDQLVGSADNTLIRVPVGTDGKVWTADSAASGGMSWQTPAAGGSGKDLGALQVLVYSGSAYPARPTGAVACRYIGPTQPTTWLANDEWVNNS